MTVAEPLTAAGFAAFGRVVDWPAHGRTVPVPVIHNGRPGVPVTLAILRLEPSALRIEQLERHPSSGQCLLPMQGGRTLVVVAPDDDQGGADLHRLRAFIAVPTQGVDYRPGVWHAGLMAMDTPACVASLLCRDGSVADVEVTRLPAAIEIVLP